jgi:hypothetical protein
MIGQNYRIFNSNILSFEEENVLSVSRKEREMKDHFDQLSGWLFAFCTVL